MAREGLGSTPTSSTTGGSIARMPPKPPVKRKGPVDSAGNPVRFDSLPTTRVILGPTKITYPAPGSPGVLPAAAVAKMFPVKKSKKR